MTYALVIRRGFRRRKPIKERQHNGQKNKQRSTKHYTENQRSSNTMVKRTNNDLQNITQKTNDRATGTPLKIEDELMCSEMVSRSCSTFSTRHFTDISVGI